MSVLTSDVRDKRLTFFRYIFGNEKGIIGVARLDRNKKDFTEDYFQWPNQADELLSWVETWTRTHDVYFCPQLLEREARKKENILTCTCAWADLDTCAPGNLKVEPNIVLETSPGRYQGFWVFDEPQDPATAEDLSRRIAYAHHEQGADKSGWDLSQLLRVPLSFNHKYQTNIGGAQVKVLSVTPGKIKAELLEEKYPQVAGHDYASIPMPEELPTDPDAILEAHKNRLMPMVWHLYQNEPEKGSWSQKLFQLEMLLCEAGLSREEVFVVCNDAKCNKFKRDGRPSGFLWKDVCRAYAHYESQQPTVAIQRLDDYPILTDQERRDLTGHTTIVDDYIQWAKTVGDAAPQYHQAGAFIILSALLAGNVKLPTSYGIVVPNLWFMILADTTLTRKTTAMDLAVDLIGDIQEDAILATDGSIEGLFTSLAMRPNKPSVFLRDEFSGLLEAMSKKDYYAGMAETLTKLYDGKFQKRILRRDVIEVRDPVLILFAGGIRSRILQLLTYEQVASGFLPRFIFITAESDVARLRPLGPPTSLSIGQRDVIRSRFSAIAEHYASLVSVTIGDKSVSHPKQWHAELTPEAWSRYNKIESDMLQVGLDSPQADVLTPVFDRLSKSGLKVATLLAASQRQEDKVVVTEQDLLKAFSYVEVWREYALEIVNNIGKTNQERTLMKIVDYVKKKPGSSRSELMQHFHLDARQTGQVFETLEQRGLITRTKHGKGERLYAINS